MPLQLVLGDPNPGGMESPATVQKKPIISYILVRGGLAIRRFDGFPKRLVSSTPVAGTFVFVLQKKPQFSLVYVKRLLCFILIGFNNVLELSAFNLKNISIRLCPLKHQIFSNCLFSSQKLRSVFCNLDLLTVY